MDCSNYRGFIVVVVLQGGGGGGGGGASTNYHWPAVMMGAQL